MDNAAKKFIEEQTEKLAAMVAKGFASTATKQEVSDLRQEVSGLQQEVSDIRANMATKDDIARLEDKIESGLGKRQQELDDILTERTPALPPDMKK